MLSITSCNRFEDNKFSTNHHHEWQVVLLDSVRLLQAVVDVISSNGWLKPALEAMELSQMIVQGVWARDSYLRQIPHFSPEVVLVCCARVAYINQSKTSSIQSKDEIGSCFLLLGTRA